jgi:Mg2+-importing ATPase
MRDLDSYWSLPPDRLMAALRGSPDGLSAQSVSRRLKRYGPNALKVRPQVSALRLLVRQFESPLILILVFAAVVAAVVKDWTDAAIVLAIILGSGLLSFAQEHRATTAVERLRAQVRVRTTALRAGHQALVASEEIVPGDIVLLSAGSLVPADGVVLEAKDFFVVQSALTGEPLPVEKQPGMSPPNAGLAQRTNCVFMGTSVRSGTARVLIVRTGAGTVYGGIADQLRLRPPETEFERGVRRYGYLLSQIMVLLVLVVFAANVFLERPPIDSLLFAIALAVGLSPELLPAIISVTLSTGARDMAGRGVIVRRLNAIENFGSMDVLCSDKTGTLTTGVMALDGFFDPRGGSSAEVLRTAYLNAALQTGLANPLDEAIVAKATAEGIDIAGTRKFDEIPYDFVRKRLSVVVADTGLDAPALMITKGALANVLAVCDRLTGPGGAEPLDAARRAKIEDRFAAWSAQGYRVLGLATKPVPIRPRYGRDDETALAFQGFLLFLDPPKQGMRETLAALRSLGIDLKVITGDNRLVAAHLAESVGLRPERMVTGTQLNDLRDEALWRLAETTDLFVEVDPSQKERIILALKKAGHVVGYLGDGINDATALHAADVGIAVQEAVDVAREAADFVLLEHDLDVLRRGVEQGRVTFANTLKYVAITTSANFGNMVSMAAASFFLPFLPLLAKQVLLNNFLSDFPAMSIAGDDVDPEMVAKPRRWDIHAIRNFMVVFGLISSLFDFLTFGVLLYVFEASAELFRTGWFVESLMTELAIALVVRTYRPFYRSRPGRLLLWSTLAVMALTLALPYLPVGVFFGFVALPPGMLGVLLAITVLYVIASEAAKLALAARLR